MKKFFLVPALMMFAAAPALAQSPSGSTPQNDSIGMEKTTQEGAKESSTPAHSGAMAPAGSPKAPSQIENSGSKKTGATPTDENKDEIKLPVK